MRDAIGEQCRKDGMTLYKVASTLDLVGIKVAMEEEELEKLVGKDPVHMAGEGYLALAVNTLKLMESRRTLFVGEKRERTESVEGEGEEIGGWARKHHECRARLSSTRTTLGPRAGPISPSRTVVRAEKH
jgi:hypothetical protein